MARSVSKKYSKTKIKRFLFFLGLASVFWFLTKFGKDFTASMEARVEYKNLPETAALSEENPKRIHFDLTANGFEILLYKLKKPVVVIDVEEYYKKKNEFRVPSGDVVQNLESNFNKYLEIRNLKPDPFDVVLDPIVLKEVAVIPDVQIGFKNGFRALGKPEVNPKSVTISGPKGVLVDIDTIHTDLLTLKSVDMSINKTIGLQLPHKEIVAITPDEVSYTMAVAEFSESEFRLPVEVINVPPGVELKLVPSHLTITFDMAVADFKDVSVEKFRVVCDYSKRNREDNFIIPELVKQPEEAVNVAIHPKKIEYYVFK